MLFRSTDRPLLRNKRTASRRNSNEYGGIFGMTDILPDRDTLGQTMSTKPGELHDLVQRMAGINDPDLLTRAQVQDVFDELERLIEHRKRLAVIAAA